MGNFAVVLGRNNQTGNSCNWKMVENSPDRVRSRASIPTHRGLFAPPTSARLFTYTRPKTNQVTYAKPGRLSAGMTCAVDIAFTPKVMPPGGGEAAAPSRR